MVSTTRTDRPGPPRSWRHTFADPAREGFHEVSVVFVPVTRGSIKTFSQCPNFKAHLSSYLYPIGMISMEPVSLFSLLVSLIICTVGLVAWYQTRSRTPLLLAIGLVFFGISFLIELVVVTPYLEELVLFFRMLAFLTILYVVYFNLGHVQAQMKALSVQNSQLESEIQKRKRAEDNSNKIRERYLAVLDGQPIPQFVIDKDHFIINWNAALESLSGFAAEEMIGTRKQWMPFYDHERPCMADLIIDGALDQLPVWYVDTWSPSSLINDAYNATSFFPKMGADGVWLNYTAALVRDTEGAVIGAVETLEDITEKKETEDDLRASEETYRSILRASPDPIVITDLQGRVQMVSPATLSLYRLESESDSIGHPVTDFLVPEDHARGRAYLKQQLEGAEIGVTEFTALLADGSTLEIEINMDFIRDDAGQPSHIIMMIRDITARREAEKAVQESQKNYKNILENIQDIYIRTDAVGTISMLSPSAVRILGYSSLSELIGENVATTLYFNPDDRSSFFARLEETGSVTNFEVLFRRKDGTPVTMLSNGQMILDASGNFLGVETIARDISERKRTELDLKQSESMYRAIFDNTGAATIILASDLTILLANTGWERLTGVPRQDQEGKMNWTAFVDGQDVERIFFYQVEKWADPSSVPANTECRIFDALGVPHYCYIEIGMIPGTPNSVASLVDITSLRLEQEKNRRALHEKEILIKEIHHRVKNNLQVVSSLIELQILSLNDEQSINALRDSQNRIRTMALIHEALYRSEDFTRIEVSSYIEKLAHSLFETNSISGERIRLNLVLDPIFLEIETGIHCGLIVTELLTNVFKHAFPGDRTGDVTIAFHVDGPDYTLTFSDNGVGIPHDIDLAESDSLGLKLVNLMVTDQLEGIIEVLREGGTTFNIRFPAPEQTR